MTDYMKLRDEIESLSRFLTKARFTAEPQKGEPGHCVMAQVFSNNVALCGLEPSYDPAYATGAAQLIALFLDKQDTILSALAQAADAGRADKGILRGSPPEPVVNPSAQWLEDYAAWYECRPRQALQGEA